MTTIVKMAVRNIWRNKRRTLITASAVTFGVLLAIIMNAFQQGAWDTTIFGLVNSFYGPVQLHAKGYWDEKTLDYAFPYPADDLAELAQAHRSIKGVLPRLESFALAATDRATEPAMVIGIDPAPENEMTGIAAKLIKGAYLLPTDQAVLIADTLAAELGIGIGDSVILVSQGYQGVNASGKYAVKGLLKFPTPQMRSMIYMPLATAQWLYGAEGMVTSLVLQADHTKALAIANALRSRTDTTTYEIMTWQLLLPELLKAKEADAGGGVIMIFILYMVIGFGIYGTILMMIKEREYEFGVLTAIGMKRHRLGLIVWLETVLITLLGVIIGSLLAFPIVYYFHINPLDLAVLSPESKDAYEKFGLAAEISTVTYPWLFTSQAITIFIITTLLAIYPFFKILKLHPVAAMRR